MRCIAASVALACTLIAAANAPAQERTRTACALEEAGSGTVRAVLDGRTLALADGRDVLLAGIEVPNDDAAKTALQAAIGGRDIVLKKIPGATDRHGRMPAYAFVSGESRAMQLALLEAGHARVSPRVGDAACAADLLAAERAARAAKRGLWADAAHAPRRTDDPPSVAAERGRLTLVEGRVISVRESGGVIYVNFGRRWSEDFTATLLKRNEKTFTAAGLDLKKLAGRTVRIRGVVEERGGPWIELHSPEQIETDLR